MGEKRRIPTLVKGDLISIVAPAKAIDESFVCYAEDWFIQRGFSVRISTHCLGSYNYFSGTDEQRLSDFQEALDDPEVKAILCARGGYGSVRILDRLNWASQLRHPKWIIGFSDITVFHQRMQRFGLPSIHGTMPLNFKENTPEALNTLLRALSGEPYSVKANPSQHDRYGEAEGKLVGGNLSILYSLLGTDDQIDYSDSILFIEDLAEQKYHIDRMLFAFSKAGVLDKIKGLIVGGMTGIKDTDQPFGMELEELILAHFSYRKIPISFNFPAGHIEDNRALILGQQAKLFVNEEGTKLLQGENKI